MSETLITSPAGIIAVLGAVTSFFFYLEKKTQWKGFNYFPPLIFIYVLPVFLSNAGFIPLKSPTYDFMGDYILPVFLVIMLLEVNVKATVKIMGKGIYVMLFGTLGVVVGAPIALFLVKHGLGPEAWKSFGALAGSWIGGTGNMAGVAYALELDESSLEFGYAVIADNAVYLIWLPIMLGSKSLAAKFQKFTKVSPDRVRQMEDAIKEMSTEKAPLEMRHLLYLIMIGFGVTAISAWLAGFIDPLKAADGSTILSTGTYKILLVSAFGVLLSFTKASKIPGSHALAMALIYLFVARMGAKADLANLDLSLFWFLAGAYIWIFIHGFTLLGAARLFKVDVHTAAIASAANIGGAASAPIVAAYHNPALVPVSILMAMLGYAVGTPAAIFAATLCRWVI